MEAIALIRAGKGYGIVLGSKILAVEGVQRVHVVTKPFSYIAEIDVGNELDKLESAIQTIRGIDGVTDVTVTLVSRTHEEQGTVRERREELLKKIEELGPDEERVRELRREMRGDGSDLLVVIGEKGNNQEARI